MENVKPKKNKYPLFMKVTSCNNTMTQHNNTMCNVLFGFKCKG